MTGSVHPNPPTIASQGSKVIVHFVKKMGKVDIALQKKTYQALQDFGHLLDADETLSFSEFANRIEQKCLSSGCTTPSIVEELKEFEKTVPVKQKQLPGVSVREIRLDRQDYSSLAKESLSLLSENFPGVRVAILSPLQSNTRESYSELNILIERSEDLNIDDLIHDLNPIKVRNGRLNEDRHIDERPDKELYVQLSGGNTGLDEEEGSAVRLAPNGGVVNLAFRINLHTVSPEAFEFARRYHSASRLMMLLQPGMKKAGLSLQPEGLKYQLGSQAITLTQSFSKMLRFAQLDPTLPEAAFRHNRRLFSYAATSPFVDDALIRKEASVLPKKSMREPLFREFSEWVRRLPRGNRPTSNEIGGLRTTLPKIINHFPDFVDRVLDFEADFLATNPVISGKKKMVADRLNQTKEGLYRLDLIDSPDGATEDMQTHSRRPTPKG